MTRTRKTATRAIKIDRAPQVRAFSAVGPIFSILSTHQHGRIICAGIIEVQERTGQHSLCALNLQWWIDEQGIVLALRLASQVAGRQRYSGGGQQQTIEEGAAWNVRFFGMSVHFQVPPFGDVGTALIHLQHSYPPRLCDNSKIFGFIGLESSEQSKSMRAFTHRLGNFSQVFLQNCGLVNEYAAESRHMRCTGLALRRVR
jgi:hypothetical protein